MMQPKHLAVPKTNFKKLYKQSRLEILNLKQALELANKKSVKKDKIIVELTAANMELTAANMELTAANMETQKEVRSLKAILKAYDNSNTPSSQQLRTSKKKANPNNIGNAKSNAKSKSNTKRKRGGQVGHQGKTSRPKPTQFQNHRPAKCPKCDSENLKDTHKKTHDVTESKKIITTTTTRHTLYTCKCLKCGKGNIAPKTDGIIPKSGNYGKSIISDVVDSYDSRMPVKRISKNSQRNIGTHISTGAICNILHRVGIWLHKPAYQILANLRKAGILHLDETSYSVNGTLFWVWIILNPYTGDAYFAIRHSRGADVLRELLPGWNGIAVCDGWVAYKGLKIQRCWAHIIREVRHLSERNQDSIAARRVLALLRRIYADAKKKRKASQRKKAYSLLVARVRKLISRYYNDALCHSFMVKLKNALGGLFTFVLYPQVPSTNNAAERGLREIVVHRKIRGCLRGQDSANGMGNIFTCLTTWKMRGLDHLAEMAKYV